MKYTRTFLFFNAWQNDLVRSGIKIKKLGEIIHSIRSKQADVYKKIRSEHIAKRKDLLNGKLRFKKSLCK